MVKAPEIDGVAIVAIGSFNPAIFQPRWLGSQGLIRTKEAENAQIEIIRPELADFTTEWFQLTVLRGAAELCHALSIVEQGRRPTALEPNQLCVVLWLKVGVHDVLLGADLERSSVKTEGWQAIIGSTERPEGRARFYKVPHHGSESADCPECWTDLLSRNPIAVLAARQCS